MYEQYKNLQKCNYRFNFEVFCIVFNPQYALLIMEMYRVAHEKPTRRLVDQHGRRSRTLFRKLNKCKCKVLTG